MHIYPRAQHPRLDDGPQGSTQGIDVQGRTYFVPSISLETRAPRCNTCWSWHNQTIEQINPHACYGVIVVITPQIRFIRKELYFENPRDLSIWYPFKSPNLRTNRAKLRLNPNPPDLNTRNQVLQHSVPQSFLSTFPALFVC